MKLKLFLTLGMVYFAVAAQAQDRVIARNPDIITGKLVRSIASLKDFEPKPLNNNVKVRDLDGIIGKDEEFEEGDAPDFGSHINSDQALQKAYNTIQPNAPTLNANFAGIGYKPLNPPDPSMCVGTTHVIQMVNGTSGAILKVFDKAGGQVVAERYLDAITGKGGLGDPICIYDQLADRYVVTEFANKSENGQEGLIIAVSTSGDASGGWKSYFFGTGNTFPDYPKFSVWTDAYYATTNDFANGRTYAGSSVYAFDKAAMIAGNATASMQRFTIGSTSKQFSMSPVCLEGTALPPAGTGGLIAYMFDDSWTSSTGDRDSIGLYEFKVNFSNASQSVITNKTSLATAAFTSSICSATRGQCISQPGTSTSLEALQQKIMNQPVYRSFAGYEGIVLSHVANVGNSISGVRWYELRSTGGNFSIYQQSSFSPDNTHRWLPGICYDKSGNIALAYNVSSSTTGVYPGARFTGRYTCDPLNTMTVAETVLIKGTGSNSSTRYGDYNHLVCDPDGVTFWFTCEWNATSQWSTRIASFTLGSCGPVSCGDPTGLTAYSITTSSADVNWSAVTGASSYSVDYKLSSATTWTVATASTSATSVSLSGLSAGSTYDWRVMATCSAGSGNYVASQFTTTQAATCGTVSGLAASAITTNSAAVSWSALNGANNYDIDYKLNSSGTWINAATATTAISVNLSNLASSTTYDWRVRANCTGATGSYAQSQFTTQAVVTGCPDILEPNDSYGGSASISTGVDYQAVIANAGDVDFYRFNNSRSQRNIQVTLSNLPANYDLRLFGKNGAVVGESNLAGTANEIINYNVANNGGVTTYVAEVFTPDGSFSTDCYTLRVDISSSTFNGPAGNKVTTLRQGIKVQPSPADNMVTVSFDAFSKGIADIIITNAAGAKVFNRKVNVDDGINVNSIDVSRFAKGVYYVKVYTSNTVQVTKLVISR